MCVFVWVFLSVRLDLVILSVLWTDVVQTQTDRKWLQHHRRRGGDLLYPLCYLHCRSQRLVRVQQFDPPVNPLLKNATSDDTQNNRTSLSTDKTQTERGQRQRQLYNLPSFLFLLSAFVFSSNPMFDFQQKNVFCFCEVWSSLCKVHFHLPLPHLHIYILDFSINDKKHM